MSSSGGGGGSNGTNGSDTEQPLKSPIWDLGAPPTELRVAAVEIEWPVVDDMAADPPAEVKMTGKPFAARFVPYGSAKLHMSRLPVVELEALEL